MNQYVSSSETSSTQKGGSDPTVFIDYQIDSSRFSIHDMEEIQKGIEHLNEKGYAVFSNVLTPEEITNNIDLFWKHLENLSSPYQIKRNDAQTWDITWPGFHHVGIIKNEGIGQSQFTWSVRGNPNVKKIFAQIWQTNELLVSFDAVGCFRDWHLNPTWKTISGWYHCDQNPLEKPARCSIQGFVSLTDNNEYSGGLVIVPESHKHFDELRSIAWNNDGKVNLVRVSQDNPLIKQFPPRLVKCKAGDLVVFDSRCIHCNTPALDTNDKIQEIASLHQDKSPRLLRVVAYVSMSPTAMVPHDKLEEFRRIREEFVRNRITCSHWAAELNIASGPSSGMKQPLKLSAYQRSLIIGSNVDPDDETTEVIDM